MPIGLSKFLLGRRKSTGGGTCSCVSEPGCAAPSLELPESCRWVRTLAHAAAAVWSTVSGLAAKVDSRISLPREPHCFHSIELHHSPLEKPTARGAFPHADPAQWINKCAKSHRRAARAKMVGKPLCQMKSSHNHPPQSKPIPNPP